MKRSEQKVENTWNLEMMYDSNNFDQDLVECYEMVDMLKKYQSIDFTKQEIISSLELYYKLLIKVENIYVYFSHQQDTDFSNDKYIAILNRVKGEYNKMMVETSFLMPKIASVANSILESIIEDDSLLEYHKSIRNIINNKKRYLSSAEERIISTYGLVSSSSYNVFSAFTNSDMRFSDVVDENNNEFKLTEALYSNYIRSTDRKLRADAFEKLLGEYKKYNQFLATNYINDLKQSYVSMQVRNYDSTLQQALEPNQIPLEVYYNLLEAVESNISYNHRYLALRQKEMKLDKLHLYDIYVSMVSDIDQKYPYEKGKELVQEAFKVFDEEYQSVVNEALTNRWIDVYENDGKRSGAYSGGSYSSVPYMLLNYTDELNDVFTLAHELGHSMHSYFANKHNPYQNANYKIFIAEVASTVNELILINYMLDQSDDSKIHKYLYNYLLEQFRTTIVRQTMFARFELETHRLVEENKEISNVVLNELYLKINKQYFGDEMEVDSLIQYEYMRIPHFYYNYYVYQYATSFSISLNVVKRILAKEEGILDKYLTFLKTGDSVYPIEALKILDIDLSTSEVFDLAMQEYNKTIDLFENVSE